MIPESMTANDPRAFALASQIRNIRRVFDEPRRIREQTALAILQAFLDWRDDGNRNPRTIDAIEVAARDLLEGE